MYENINKPMNKTRPTRNDGENETCILKNGEKWLKLNCVRAVCLKRKKLLYILLLLLLYNIYTYIICTSLSGKSARVFAYCFSRLVFIGYISDPAVF